ncbi:MAG: hypothetical protein LJE64_03570 [Desulfofustis sp.]|nr:hypothetical protein [Desulfofustis sp.]
MIRTVAVILLVVHMVLGMVIWLEDHDDNRRRVIRLGAVIVVAVLLLSIIFLTGETPRTNP